MAQSGTITLGQSGPGSDGNEEVVRIPQSSNIAGTSPSDCLESYQDTRWGGGSYPSAEKHSVYSIAPADWAKTFKNCSECTYYNWYHRHLHVP